MWYSGLAAPSAYESKPRGDSICTDSSPANPERFMLAVMPDPDRDSNSDSCSKNQRYNNPWPFERRLDDRKVFLSRLLVAMSLRQ